MKRPWQIWTLFALCLAIVLPAMSWLTIKAVELDRARNEAQQQTELARRQAETAHHQADLARQEAELQELVSSALWRMDWSLTPLVAQESARPYFVYRSFYQSPGSRPTKGGGEEVPSPLLVQPSEYVLLNFQISSTGQWTSPQSPDPSESDLALQSGASPENIDNSARLLAELSGTVDGEKLLAMLPNQELPTIEFSGPAFASNTLSLNYGGQLLNPAQQALPAAPQSEPTPPPGNQAVTLTPPEQSQVAQADDPEGESQIAGYGSNPRQQLLLGNEWQLRNRGYQAYAYDQVKQQRANSPAIDPPAHVVREGVSRPLWVGSNLLLARRVVLGEQVYIQGCWLNWPRIMEMLLAEVADLLPQLQLAEVTPGIPVPPGRALATLPVQLVVPPLAVSAAVRDFDAVDSAPGKSPSLSPIQFSLVIAWSGMLLATVAVAVLLRGVVGLSERRGAFVSAVTHELRTPLTTFRMYAEMLAEGMVPQPEKRQAYLNTLRVEADRLWHLVENVLTYARLERGRPVRQREELTLDRLLERFQTRLEDRAAQAEMQLELDLSDDVRGTRLRTDPTAVEQVLFNLVDNACKYAAAATDRRIHLDVSATATTIALRVRDHGAGITRHEARRLFRPFSKSVQEAARSAPGVGLGLALCRRLARDLGGRLELESHPNHPGATFVLLLPK